MLYFPHDDLIKYKLVNHNTLSALLMHLKRFIIIATARSAVIQFCAKLHVLVFLIQFVSQQIEFALSCYKSWKFPINCAKLYQFCTSFYHFCIFLHAFLYNFCTKLLQKLKISHCMELYQFADWEIITYY